MTPEQLRQRRRDRDAKAIRKQDRNALDELIRVQQELRISHPALCSIDSTVERMRNEAARARLEALGKK